MPPAAKRFSSMNLAAAKQRCGSAAATVGEGPGVVSRGHSSLVRRYEGQNPLLQGASLGDSMGVEQQRHGLPTLSWSGGKENLRSGVPGEGGNGTGASEEQQAPTAGS